jgi:hypothetical protein
MRLRYFTPLLGFLLPTIIIGFGVVIPRSCIAGINSLTLGFVSSLAGVSLSYWFGLRLVVRDKEAPNVPR